MRKFNDNGDIVARVLRNHHNDLFKFGESLGLPKNLRTKYKGLNKWTEAHVSRYTAAHIGEE